jgi:hypothetical protein
MGINAPPIAPATVTIPKPRSITVDGREYTAAHIRSLEAAAHRQANRILHLRQSLRRNGITEPMPWEDGGADQSPT